MSKIKLTGDSSGYVEISAPSAAGNNTLELPSSGSKIVVADASDNVNVAGILTSVGGLNVGTGGTVITTTASGRIGIGTDNPQRELDILGPSTDGTNLLIRTSGSNSAGLKMVPGPSGNEYEIQAVSSAAGTNPNSFIIYDRTNSAYRMVIDSSGRVTMPYQPRFFAWSNSSQVVSASGSVTATLWNQTLFNVGSHFSANVFTAPIAGCYLFGTQIRYDNADTGYFRLILSLNNSTSPNGQGHSIRQGADAQYHTMAVTALYEMSANDTVKVVAESSGDTSWVVQNESSFWGYLVA